MIILPVGLLIVLSNYFIDPANLFSSKEYVAGIAAILSKGHNVDNISNYDERLLQEQLIIHLKKPPDVVILGSSRVMEIGSDFFPDKNILNAGVSHANIHDLVALTGLLDSMDRLPKEFYINIDPSMISQKGTQEWQSLSPYHDYLIKKLGSKYAVHKNVQSNSLNKIYTLFSFQYFKESLAFIFKRLDKKYQDVGKKKPLIYGRFSDGTVCYSNDYMTPDTLRVSSNARNTAIKEGLSEADSSKIELLNALLDFYQSNHLKVNFIMLPYHYQYYSNINNYHQDLFHKYESFFRDLAKRKGISVTGSFDAASLNIQNSQFYDMYHCSKEAIKKIMFN